MANAGRRLWGHRDFLKLWCAKTVSDFGSLVSRTALSFTAILYLKASPAQLGLLMAADLLPRFLTGPAAGLLADRLPRRAVMIGADLGRALLLATVPVAALGGRLNIVHLYIVTAATGLLSLLFEVADHSYLPTLVPAEDLVAANSRLTATSSVAEFGAFSIGGWLVQWFTAPFAILIDAVTFLFSALALGRIRAIEPRPERQTGAYNARLEFAAGCSALRHSAVLMALAWVAVLMGVGGGIEGATIVAFMARDLGFHPGILGMIWSIGGIASLGGALLAERVLQRVRLGPLLATSLAIVTAGILATSSAHGHAWAAAALLAVNQLSDAAYTVFEIHKTSLKQSTIPVAVLGRVNGLFETIGIGATLAGALLGGWLGQTLGLRTAVALGAVGFLAAAGVIRFSSLYKVEGGTAGSE